MTAFLDFRTIRDFVAYPIRWVLSDASENFETHPAKARTPLILRWRRNEDGKLEGHWDTE